VVTTLAGTAGSSGSADSIGTAARFNGPGGMAVDGAGIVPHPFRASRPSITIFSASSDRVLRSDAG
jgi:hypothetical protein